jgi:triphosphoribosyl-dephospho-CoA synthetase
MDVYVVKSLLGGVHLAFYSSIKPGSIHRLRLDIDLESIYANTVSAIDYIIEATDLGERVRRGDLPATHMGIGNLIGRALREAYRWNPRHVYPDYIVPQIIYGFALSYSEPDSIIKDYGKVKRGLDLVLRTRVWREIRAFIDSLRSIHRNDMVEHLEASGISGLSGVVSEVELTDVARILGSRWPAFISMDLQSSDVLEYLKKLMNYYREYGNANNALVRLYLDMIWRKLPDWARSIAEEALKEGLMMSRDGSRKLFELDLKLRKQGISYVEYTGLLAIVTGLAVYEGLRPP